MAESNENWLGSWFTAAKDKLKNSEVFESVRKDLEEFGGAVSKGATSVLSSTGNVLEKTLSLDSPDSTASSVKRSFSTFLDQVNTVLNPSPDDSDTEAIMITEGSETVALSKLQQLILNLQMNETTFTTEPEAHLTTQYECWLEIMEDQVSDDRIEKYLKSSDVLRKQYEKLVPETVSKDSFWRRYLFKKAIIEDEIARQEIQEKKEQKENQLVEAKVEWDKGNLQCEKFGNDIELTEEQQIQLLEDYERERKIKKKSPTPKKQSIEESNPSSPTQLQKPKNDDPALSLDNTSSSSSIDDEWEKINEVEK